MEFKVENKYTVLEGNGCSKSAQGINEYLQRAYISFTVPKESFCYHRNLGVLKNLKEIEDISELIKEAQAALWNTPEIEVVKAEKESDCVIFTLNTPLGIGKLKI